MNTEGNYDPLEVERAIDDAYKMAEEIELFGELVMDQIKIFEKLPYSVHQNGEYTDEQLENAVVALNQMQNIYYDYDASPAEVMEIERMLTKKALRPVRDQGSIILSDSGSS